MQSQIDERLESSTVNFRLETESAWIRQTEKRILEELGIRDLESHGGAEAALKRFSAIGIYDYFKASRIDVRKDQSYDLEVLKKQLGLLPQFEKFLRFMVNVLAEDGIVDLTGARARFLKDPAEYPDSVAFSHDLERAYPAFQGLITILRHCFGHYREALTGEIPAISVLYPDGTSRLLDESSNNTVEYKRIRAYELLLQEVLSRIVNSSGDRLRILEVGAGRGILAGLIAQQLKGKNVEYHFTDIGKSFVVQARKRFLDQGLDFMKFSLLDISKDARQQGYDLSSFDIIMGLNVVHATPSISDTLKNLKGLLIPDGLLFVLEAVQAYRWDSLIWGLAEGWWYFNDGELRTDSPLLGLDQWDQVLRNSGFNVVRAFPEDFKRSRADSALMIAQNSRNQGGARTDAATAGALTIENPVNTHTQISPIERTAYPDDKCVHELFEAQVNRTPDARALFSDGQELSYRDLNSRANRLAHHLRALGVRQNSRVAISADASIEMVIGIYGILKAGGAYVPLDPAYPQDRLNYMIESAEAPVLVTQEAIAKRWKLPRTEIVSLDSGWREIARNSDCNPERLSGPDDLIYVIYTSGSTGRPKGAGVYHRGFSNLLHWFTKTFEVSQDDRTLLVSSLSFDLTQKNLFATLLCGGELHLPPEAHYDPGRIAQAISKQGITLINCTPSAFYPLIELGGAAAYEKLNSLRVVFLGGEPISIPRLRRWLESDRCHSEVANTYGPTECTDICAFYRMKRQNMDAHPFVPIGRPIFNTQLLILDEDSRPCPLGLAGELCVGGDGVGAGYVDDPELTAVKFIRSPVLEVPGTMYKTGDLVRWLPDGNIEFLGRKDHQIKLRGFRIELPEIERTLAQHPSVTEAVVVTWPPAAAADGAGDQRLVAYFVPRGNPAPSAAELQRYLGTRLPDYMVPPVILPLEGMPLSPNGKVDRSALPPPTRQRPALAQPYVSARNDLELWLAGLWREILNLDSVGMEDRFFELGGNSLQAAGFINRIQRELGEWVYVIALFDAPSIAEFAAFLRANYPAALASRFPSEASEALFERRRNPNGSSRVDRAMIARMRECIPTLDAEEIEGESRVPCQRAIFVLAPPRSGTTLLRVMLAGHPDLFAVPELHLLGFRTLTERRAALSGKFAIWLEGVLRVIMEIEKCDPDAARRIMEDYERQGLTTKQFYQLIQSLIAPRMLVEKTPAYALDLNAMTKAERDFGGAAYIHLLRHPYAAIRSFESYHMDQVQILRDHDFAPRDLGELVWTISHQNILEFLEEVPPERQYRMRFEDLTREPRPVMEAMCERFGLPFHSDLLSPYKDQEKKMTDGLYEGSTPMGDRKFLAYGTIDPKVAEAWRAVESDNFLGDPTWEVAATLGYDPPAMMSGRTGPEDPAEHRPAARANRMQRQREIRKSRREAELKE